MGSGSCHNCDCQRPPDVWAGDAMVVRSSAPTVPSVLARSFERVDGTRDVFRIPVTQLDALRELLDGLSLIERRATQAVLTSPDGSFDPWSAGPVDQVLCRVDSPWITDVLRGEGLAYHYQPIIHPISGAVHGHEALMRCRLNDEPVSPVTIIEASKAHDALLALDQVCRTTAIRSSADYLADGGRLFVNFIPISIYDPATCLRTTFAAVRSTGARFDQLVFEVVESEEFPDTEHLRRILDAYRSEGALVALDDVGAGNTSINYIDELNPDYIKLDRMLLERAVATGESAIFVGLVRHAQERGITVIAEGLEDARHLEFCRELGVDLVQGFYLGRPAAEPLTEPIGWDRLAA